MTIINTAFDYAAQIRKRGHRKTSDVLVRQLAPFEIPDFTGETAPVALKLRNTAKKTRPRGSENIHSVLGGLFAPVVDDQGRPQAAATFGPQTAEMHTELYEAPVDTLFLMNKPGFERVGDPVHAGHHLIESRREEDQAAAARRAGNSLASIDGMLHMRIPEPMYVVNIEWSSVTKSKPSVVVDFDQTPGFLSFQSKRPSGAVGHFRLDQRIDAEQMAETVAEKLGFLSPKQLVEKIAGAVDPSEMRKFREATRRPNEPEVVDASLLSADPLLVTLEQSIRSLLQLGHEALIAAPDAFVLAWADMRESLVLLEAGHADAASMAADAVRDFLAHAPTEPEQFANAAERKRWDTRTLPLLQARAIVIEALASPRCEIAPVEVRAGLR